MAIEEKSALWIFQDLPGREDLVDGWFQGHEDAIASALAACKAKVYSGAGGDVMPQDISNAVRRSHKQMHANYLLALAMLNKLRPKWEKSYAANEVEMPPNFIPGVESRLKSMFENLHQFGNLYDFAETLYGKAEEV